jgi:hypothetical protein
VSGVVVLVFLFVFLFVVHDREAFTMMTEAYFDDVSNRKKQLFLMDIYIQYVCIYKSAQEKPHSLLSSAMVVLHHSTYIQQVFCFLE